jgi:hypothetical protein
VKEQMSSGCDRQRAFSCRPFQLHRPFPAANDPAAFGRIFPAREPKRDGGRFCGDSGFAQRVSFSL